MINKIISIIVILSLFFGSGLSAYAAEASQPVDLVKKLVAQSQFEIKIYGAPKDDTISQLNSVVQSIDKRSGSYGDMKPHVHVLNNGREIGIENVDGTSSHGRNLSGVPKEIKEKVRNSGDYKKGQQDLKKMKEAKAEIISMHLNLENGKDLILATGIFIAIVGILFFAPEALPFVLVGI